MRETGFDTEKYRKNFNKINPIFGRLINKKVKEIHFI